MVRVQTMGKMKVKGVTKRSDEKYLGIICTEQGRMQLTEYLTDFDIFSKAL